MTRLTSEELVLLIGKEENPTIVAEALDRFVNNMSMDKEGFMKTLQSANDTTQTKFTFISLFWIQKMNYYYKRGFYDLRNEYVVETSNKLMKLLDGELSDLYQKCPGHISSEYPAYEGYLPDGSFLDEVFEVMVVEQLGRLHRTLQQSFSELVFRWLITLKDVSNNEYFIRISNLIVDGTDEYFYRAPFI